MHAGGKIDWGAGERPFIGKVGEEVGNVVLLAEQPCKWAGAG